VFFLSSRRRHTRSKRDWSSDVCSSDLNRDRLLAHDVIPALFGEVVELARQRDLVSDEHFSVDGTLIQAWASQKSFRPKDDQDGEIGRASCRERAERPGGLIAVREKRHD